MGYWDDPIDPKDLRPFSVEDPTGERQRELSRARRSGHASATAAAQRPESPHTERREANERRDAARQAVAGRQEAATRQARRPAQRPPRREQKKGSGCGCFTLGCLLPFVALPLIIGVPLAATLGPTLVELFEAWQLESSGRGVPTAARIISLESTNTSLNEETVWKLHLEVQPSGAAPYEVTIERPLASGDAESLRAGGWATVLVDPSDPDTVALVRPGAPTPPSDPTADLPPTDASAEPSASPLLGSAPPGAVDAPTAPSAGATDGVPAVCAAAHACCLTVLGENAGDGCNAYLQRVPTTTHCEQALPLLRDAGARLGRTCQ
jgi:hypothetical protein